MMYLHPFQIPISNLHVPSKDLARSVRGPVKLQQPRPRQIVLQDRELFVIGCL